MSQWCRRWTTRRRGSARRWSCRRSGRRSRGSRHAGGGRALRASRRKRRVTSTRSAPGAADPAVLGADRQRGEAEADRRDARETTASAAVGHQAVAGLVCPRTAKCAAAARRRTVDFERSSRRPARAAPTRRPARGGGRHRLCRRRGCLRRRRTRGGGNSSSAAPDNRARTRAQSSRVHRTPAAEERKRRGTG